MNTRISALLAAVVALGASIAQAADRGDVKKGKDVFEYWCLPCHGNGPMKPGTSALEAKYKGTRPAKLEDRTDLTPDLTRFFVRTGVNVMPPFRKTEISDADLKALGAYLARPRP
ncbi:MAG: cytochrome c [Gammaproteobacteria bacterium]